MKNIKYVELLSIDHEELLKILNKSKVREHLVSHEEFDNESLETWIQSKIQVNSTPGCKVKGIVVGNSVAGWCGIQFESGAYELAIVIDDAFWGIGTTVFSDVMGWASEEGHNSIVLHLFHTRPEYSFLKKIAHRVFQSSIFGETYTSYELVVKSA